MKLPAGIEIIDNFQIKKDGKEVGVIIWNYPAHCLEISVVKGALTDSEQNAVYQAVCENNPDFYPADEIFMFTETKKAMKEAKRLQEFLANDMVYDSEIYTGVQYPAGTSGLSAEDFPGISLDFNGSGSKGLYAPTYGDLGAESPEDSEEQQSQEFLSNLLDEDDLETENPLDYGADAEIDPMSPWAETDELETEKPEDVTSWTGLNESLEKSDWHLMADLLPQQNDLVYFVDVEGTLGVGICNEDMHAIAMADGLGVKYEDIRQWTFVQDRQLVGYPKEGQTVAIEMPDISVPALAMFTEHYTYEFAEQCRAALLDPVYQFEGLNEGDTAVSWDLITSWYPVPEIDELRPLEDSPVEPVLEIAEIDGPETDDFEEEPAVEQEEEPEFSEDVLKSELAALALKKDPVLAEDPDYAGLYTEKTYRERRAIFADYSAYVWFETAEDLENGQAILQSALDTDQLPEEFGIDNIAVEETDDPNEFVLEITGGSQLSEGILLDELQDSFQDLGVDNIDLVVQQSGYTYESKAQDSSGKLREAKLTENSKDPYKLAKKYNLNVFELRGIDVSNDPVGTTYITIAPDHRVFGSWTISLTDTEEIKAYQKHHQNGNWLVAVHKPFPYYEDACAWIEQNIDRNDTLEGDPVLSESKNSGEPRLKEANRYTHRLVFKNNDPASSQVYTLRNADSFRYHSEAEAQKDLEKLNKLHGQRFDSKGIHLEIEEIPQKPRRTHGTQDADYQNPFEVGDLLCGDIGYSQTLPVWVEVIRTTAKNVFVKRLKSKVISHDGYGQAGMEVPSLRQYQTGYLGEAPEVKCLVKKHSANLYKDLDPTAKESYYIVFDGHIFDIWDGKAKAFDTYD